VGGISTQKPLNLKIVVDAKTNQRKYFYKRVYKKLKLCLGRIITVDIGNSISSNQ